jgi:hypothetical protein
MYVRIYRKIKNKGNDWQFPRGEGGGRMEICSQMDG